MADFNVSVGLELDTSPFEQGIAQAHATLEQLNQAMLSSAASMQQLASGILSSWGSINSSIQQAISLAHTLSSISVNTGSTGAVAAGAGAGAASGASGGALENMVTRAVQGMSVQLDGKKVGNLVAPVVNELIGSATISRRFHAI